MKAGITSKNKHPMLSIDDRAVSPMAVYLRRIDPVEVRRFADAGIHIYTFRMYLSEDGIFSEFDRDVESLVSADPEALFFPRVRVEPSRQWLDAHPGDVVTDEFGKLCNRLSFASTGWVDTMGPVFTAFVRHMEESHGGRIVGYHISAGLCDEWFWGCGDDIDFSRAAVEGFRKWAREKYKNSIHALNSSWKISDAPSGFGCIAPPSTEERAAADLSDFKCPGRRQYITDYYNFLSETAVKRIAHFAGIAKRETKGSKLVGVFYGYTDDVSGYLEAKQLQGCAHGAMSKLLECPHVDFIASPYNYYDRTQGGSDRVHCAIDSVNMHGKLFYCEADTRTALAEYQPSFPDLKIQDMGDSVEVIKRNFSYALCKSSGIWWMELTGCEWFNDPRILDVMSLTQQVYRRAVESPGNSTAQIAVILDEKAPLLLSGSAQTMHANVYYQLPQIARIGAPYDLFLMEDFDRIKDYNLYIFPNLFCADSGRVEAIHRKLMANNATAVWLYAPGITDGEQISVENMERLTGIEISCTNVKANIRVQIENTDHAVTSGVEKGFVFGGEAPGASNKGFLVQHGNPPLGPVFHACDAGAEVLGRTNIGFNPGLVFKALGGWNSLYSAIGAVPANILRNTARGAGVHIYSNTDDTLYANSRWVALHTRAAGKRRITLPAKADVKEVFSGAIVCRDESEFEFDADARSTYLFELISD